MNMVHVTILGMGLSFGLAVSAEAGDPHAGMAKAEACTVCHGQNGISLSADIPNLAGQKDAYLKQQLKNFRSGARKNPFMGPIADTLSDSDINDIAAYFSNLPHSGGHAKSDFGKDINTARLELPSDYQKTFTRYHIVNRSDRNERREIFANDVAIAAVKKGEPLPDGAFFLMKIFKAELDSTGKPVQGEDGLYKAAGLKVVTGQKVVKGAGDKIPNALQNDDWLYGAFKEDGSAVPVNLAKCFACHKGQEDDQHLFSLSFLESKVGAQ